VNNPIDLVEKLKSEPGVLIFIPGKGVVQLPPGNGEKTDILALEMPYKGEKIAMAILKGRTAGDRKNAQTGENILLDRKFVKGIRWNG
jgi:hypothetical protein